MLLTENEINAAIETVKAAFPNLSNWQYQNTVSSECPGFSLWGQFVLKPDGPWTKDFFITFYIYQVQWRGSLTVGQHAYFWSSTEEGDSYLLNTELCDSLETAIAALKAEISRLFAAFLAL
ncbi:hypothetical protein [Gloeobacter kilaueensis]|uniref:Uncharacterized protein n=1 Tax=Gloeobacter kilaueensis (strain ATCC BAA-2537 / CCAP 1431/1 / ULC 316 / JS1) TaxID=1183438 RepID=U5QCI5_GLOK1|nr:hypothetical protein [Gloeobacter kilaueensis]AGY56553.1 hypothetical protein GKIL_0306 [Gloeobacter kilaueensis JS1]